MRRNYQGLQQKVEQTPLNELTSWEGLRTTLHTLATDWQYYGSRAIPIIHRSKEPRDGNIYGIINTERGADVVDGIYVVDYLSPERLDIEVRRATYINLSYINNEICCFESELLYGVYIEE